MDVMAALTTALTECRLLAVCPLGHVKPTDRKSPCCASL